QFCGTHQLCPTSFRRALSARSPLIRIGKSTGCPRALSSPWARGSSARWATMFVVRKKRANAWRPWRWIPRFASGRRRTGRLAQGEGWGPGSPPIADEWSVEARGGGICVVRVVHSLFASTDDRDNQLEGTESGWPGFFRILRIYLTHFRGQRSAMMQWIAPAAGTEAEAWDT